MADQAQMKIDSSTRVNGAAGLRSPLSTDGADIGPRAGVVSNVAGFGESLLSLAELQTRLTAVELRQNMDSVKAGATALTAACIVAFSCVPVFLLAAAELLVSEFGMKRGFALLTVASSALGLAAFVAFLAVRTLNRKKIGFALSREEFTRNVNWLRTILRHSGRPVSPR
jgi:uncharacterized membrane protein YdjX (TVP38/TMEM64 family)